MSEWAEYYAETRRQRRLREERARRTARRYIRRYEEVLERLEQEGLGQFVSSEIQWVQNRIRELEDLLATDPMEAQRALIQLGPDVHALPRLARRAQAEFLEAQRRREQELRAARKEALQQTLDALFEELVDPVERDFAYDEVRALVSGSKSLVESSLSPEEVVVRVREEFNGILSRARERAREWKTKQREQAAVEAFAEAVAATEQILREERMGDAATLEALARLRTLAQQQAGSQQELSEVAAGVADLVEQTERGHPDEEDRRMIVRSILEVLQGLGFVVDPPRRVQEGERDVVVVAARKPAGQRAELHVTADGQVAYKFDRYEGMQCKEDINSLLAKMRDVYGIHLSHERVIWQNPDRKSRDARSPGISHGEQSHG